MKAICDKRGWKHDPNATVKTLLQVLFDNGLVPSFWNSHFSALRSTLEAGVPPARNKLGGHGQGSQVVEVPEYMQSSSSRMPKPLCPEVPTNYSCEGDHDVLIRRTAHHTDNIGY